MPRVARPLTADEIGARARPILANYGVRRAAIFGSAARGQLRARSEVDFLVELTVPIGLFRFVGLKLELEEALGRKVDLVTIDAIKPALRARILRELVPIA
ncbi:MAG: nucleotidyltransferase family protein [Candidatus Dormibacteraceae bacterium]